MGRCTSKLQHHRPPGRGIRTALIPPVPIALLLLAVALLAGCSAGGPKEQSRSLPASQVATAAAAASAASVAPTTPAAAAFPYTLTGTGGTSVKLAGPAQRIVSLSPGTTETLFAIGAGQSVVAADRFSDFPEAAKALPKVEYTRPSIEALAGFRPDLIITAGRQKDTVAAIQAAGLPVVMLDESTSVQGVIDRVRLMGRITGRSADADRLAAGMEQRIRAVTGKLAGVDRGPRVYHELSMELYTAAPSGFVGDLYTLLKARNIAEGAAGSFPQLSQEVIVQRDPEVIVLTDGREGVTVEQVRSRPGWSAISAVRSGRVHLLSDVQADTVSRPGPRVVEGLETLAKLLYPERF